MTAKYSHSTIYNICKRRADVTKRERSLIAVKAKVLRYPGGTHLELDEMSMDIYLDVSKTEEIVWLERKAKGDAFQPPTGSNAHLRGQDLRTVESA